MPPCLLHKKFSAEKPCSYLLHSHQGETALGAQDFSLGGHREGSGKGTSLGLSWVNTVSPGPRAHSLALHPLGKISALHKSTDLEVSLQGNGYYLTLAPADC